MDAIFQSENSNPSVINREDQLPKIESLSKSNRGLVAAAIFGVTGFLTMAISVPFILPALRKHCLPYVPATELQLANLVRAFRQYSKSGDSFLDIGSGDGRICRQAAQLDLYSQIHGVELNSVLVTYSKIYALFSFRRNLKFFHQDLWKFPLNRYDSICIFGVESMMEPLQNRLIQVNSKRQIIFACRFPFENLHKIGEFGSGIDTVWVYELPNKNEYHSSKI